MSSCTMVNSSGHRLLNHGAVFHTGAAPRAQIHVNASSAFSDLYLEVSGFAVNGFKIRIGDEFDIQMPADLDQYR